MDDLIFYVYGSKDPYCSCCSWEYFFEEYENIKEAKENKESLEKSGFCCMIIKGMEIDD